MVQVVPTHSCIYPCCIAECKPPRLQTRFAINITDPSLIPNPCAGRRDRFHCLGRVCPHVLLEFEQVQGVHPPPFGPAVYFHTNISLLLEWNYSVHGHQVVSVWVYESDLQLPSGMSGGVPRPGLGDCCFGC